MEQQPTPVQLERQRRVDKLVASAENDEITSQPGSIHATLHPETLYGVRRILQEPGHIARRNSPNRL